MCLVLGMIIFLPQRFARYGLLVGTITGWLLWFFCFPSSHSLSGELHWQWFPLGSGGALSPGIILTAVITGLVNISNTYGAIRYWHVLSAAGRGNTRYRRSFVATGFMTLITVPLGNSIFTVCFIHWFINPDWRLHAAFVYLWQRYLPAGGAGSGTHATVLQYPFTRE